MTSFSAPKISIAVILATFLCLAACGDGSSTANPSSVTGNWTVTLYDSNNSPLYVFTTKLNQEIASPSTTSPITGSNLNMTTDSTKTCFTAGSSAEQTGLYTINDNFNGLTTNTVRLNIKGNAENSGAATLDLRGTFTTRGVSGPWTLTTPNADCLKSGVFLMTRI